MQRVSSQHPARRACTCARAAMAALFAQRRRRPDSPAPPAGPQHTARPSHQQPKQAGTQASRGGRRQQDGKAAASERGTRTEQNQLARALVLLLLGLGVGLLLALLGTTQQAHQDVQLGVVGHAAGGQGGGILQLAASEHDALLLGGHACERWRQSRARQLSAWRPRERRRAHAAGLGAGMQQPVAPLQARQHGGGSTGERRRQRSSCTAALTLARLDGGLHIGHGGRGAELQHMRAVCGHREEGRRSGGCSGAAAGWQRAATAGWAWATRRRPHAAPSARHAAGSAPVRTNTMVALSRSALYQCLPNGERQGQERAAPLTEARPATGAQHEAPSGLPGGSASRRSLAAVNWQLRVRPGPLRDFHPNAIGP